MLKTNISYLILLLFYNLPRRASQIIPDNTHRHIIIHNPLLCLLEKVFKPYNQLPRSNLQHFFNIIRQQHNLKLPINLQTPLLLHTNYIYNTIKNKAILMIMVLI